MKNLKTVTVIILICLAFSAFSGTIVMVQACSSVSKLVISSGASQVLQAGAVSNQITIQLQDASGGSVDADSNVAVNLVTSASSSGHFYSDKNGQNQVSMLTIKQGQNSVSFFYKDMAVGNPTLVATSQSLTSATTQFTINSASPTPSPTSSPSPSLSPTPSPTPSISPTPTPMPSSSPDPSQPPSSPTPSPSPSPTSSVSPTSTPSSSPTPTPSPTSSLTPSPSPSPTTMPTPSTSPTTNSPNPTQSPSSLTSSPTSNQPASSTYKITVISPHGSPTASANVKSGESFIVQVSSPVGDTTHRWICTGFSIDGGKEIMGAIYTFTNVQAVHTITFNWQEQYYLTVISKYGSTGGGGWYNSGSTAHFTVTSKDTAENGTQVSFVDWNGIGTGAYNGPETLPSVIMNNPIKETANWTTYTTSLATTSLYTVAEASLILFALIILLSSLIAWRTRRRKIQTQMPIQNTKK